MSAYLIPGLCGLLLGLILHWTQLSHPWRKPYRVFLSGVTALGWALLGAALLTWLAVLPPSAPTALTCRLLRYALLYALSAWACGFSPLTALAGLKFRPAEALCVLLGCGAGSLFRRDLAALHAPAEAFFATLPDLPVWLGFACVVAGMIGVLAGWRRLREPLSQPDG